MKSILLLFTTSLVIATSAALAQDACSDRYGSCVDACSSRPQSVQESCSKSCEMRSDECYDGLFGRRPASDAAASFTPVPRNTAAPAPEPHEQGQ